MGEKNVKYLFYAILAMMAFCVSSCKKVNRAADVSDVTVFNIDDIQKKDSALEAETYELLPLENNDSCMLQDVFKVVVRETCIFVLDRNPYPRICVFGHDGEFKNLVGERGHGKNEYVDIDNFSVSEHGDTVMLLCHDKLKLFRNDGKYLTTIDVGGEYTWDDVLCAESGPVFCTYHHAYDHLMSEWNMEWKEAGSYVDYPHDIVKFGEWNVNLLQQDKESVCFLDAIDNTFYVINKRTKKVSSYELVSKGMMKLGDNPDDAIMDGKHDFVDSYVYAGGVIRGYLNVRGTLQSFRLDTKKKTLDMFKVSERHYGADAYHDGWFYSVVDLGYLKMCDNYHIRPKGSEIEKFHEAISGCIDTMTVADNYLVLKIKIRE